MATLTYENHRGGRETVGYTKIKRGTFARVHFATPCVYVVVSDDCFDKEMLQHVSGPHIPECEHVGSTRDGQVYKMPEYGKLTAKNARAWGEYRRLLGAYNQALKAVKTPSVQDSLKIAAHMTDSLGDDDQLGHDFAAMESWASAYGAQIRCEVSPRNCAVGRDGQLIMLDLFFDTVELSKIRDAQAKAHEQRERARRWHI